MEKLFNKIVDILKNNNETISLMESCTGGFLTNKITNVDGASKVLKVSLVTYSNEYKIKFGVDKNTINKYGVYSMETANEMAEQISEFAKADWGIGITGEIGDDSGNEVYYSIYNRKTQELNNKVIIVKGDNRQQKKLFVTKRIVSDLLELITIN